MKAKLILAMMALLTGFLPAQASPEDAAKANNELALKLLAAAGPGNAAFSPYSAQMALAMTYVGAEGETRQQMATALQYPKPDMADSFASLQSEIQKTSGKTALLSANRLFGQSGYPFRPEYLSTVKKAFGSELQPMDFSKPDAAARTINAWVEKMTRDRIRNLLQPDDLGGARLVLVNAIYFKAAWEKAFEKSRTTDRPFYRADGKEIQVPTMQATRQYGLEKFSGFSALTLPYADRDLQLVIILPDEKQKLAAVEKKLDAKVFQKCAALRTQEVALFLPRFKLEPPLWNMGATLEKLGMKSAFDLPAGSADFGGIAPRTPRDYLYISKVLQKCFVEVNEEGTEAAAATAVVMTLAAALPSTQPPEIHVDRPFLFAIQHRPTGALLFLGRVTDPSK